MIVPAKRVLLLLALVGSLVFAWATPAAALPPETPDDTWHVNDDVRAMDLAGGRIFLGGRFSEASENPPGEAGQTTNSRSVVAFDATSEAPVAPVWTVQVTHTTKSPVVYGVSEAGGRLYICGRFNRVDGTSRSNVAALDADTGSFIASFTPKAGVCRSILAADGKVYAGGRRWLRAYSDDGTQLWKTTTDHNVRAIESNGTHLWIAGQFTELDGAPHRVVAQVLASDGTPTSWELSHYGTKTFGIDLYLDGNDLYTAMGGSDYAALYRASDGQKQWKTDTSGSAQAIAPFGDGNVIVGGHFKWVADADTRQCGSNSSPKPGCEKRLRLAALDADTGLVQSWAPDVKGHYNGVWALEVDEVDGARRLHVGGEFKKIEGVPQFYYGRLSTAV